MTVENDFLPIAIGGTPNVQDQGDYAGSLEQVQGYAIGEIPSSGQLNKMLRQSSSIMALLAAFLVLSTGQPMVDDGNQATKLAIMQQAFRLRLTANTNFNVATAGNGGSDANDGITAPWLTLQHAVNTLLANYDCASGFVPTINIGTGIFAGASISGQIPGQLGQPFIINGNGSGNTILSSGLEGSNGALFTYQNLAVGSTTFNAIVALSGAVLNQGAGILLTGAQATSGLMIAGSGGTINITANYSYEGNCGFHYQAENSGIVDGDDFTATAVSATTYSLAFAVASGNGNLGVSLATYSGSPITGSRYLAQYGGNIGTQGGGANFFPGTIAGTAPTGYYS